MPEEVKFTEEELTQVQNIQRSYTSLQTQFGQLHMAKINLKKQYDDLQRIEEETQKRFEEVQKEENDLIETLTGKYGKGQLDPATGVFTPASEEKSNS